MQKTNKPLLIDSHCHLNLCGLSCDTEALVQRARSAGVVAMQTVCTSLREFADLLSITKRYGGVFCSIGLHPSNVCKEAPLTTDKIIEYSKFDKVIGIGETGLDYHYSQDSDYIALQKRSFVEHIQAAQITGLPLIVHTREADVDTIAILKEHYLQCPFRGLIHCFTASNWLAQEAMTMGLYLSASGIVTFKAAQMIQDVFREAPLDRVLIETDAPFLAPVPHRGQTNEPAYVKEVASYLSVLRGVSYETIAKQTTDNFLKLFSKAAL